MIYIKQYGAKRSGTNYTRWLLQENFDVHVLSEVLGWKHGPHPEAVDWSGRNWVDMSHANADDERQGLLALATSDIRRAVEAGEMRYAVTVKNPYAWWDSYMRFVETKRPDLAMPAGGGVSLWNSLHANWHALSEHNPLATVVRYEDLLLDFENTLERIAAQLRIPRKGESGYRDTEVHMARRSDLNWAMGPTGKRFDPSYYTNRRYLGRFDAELLGLFRSGLNHELIGALGYEVL